MEIVHCYYCTHFDRYKGIDEVGWCRKQHTFCGWYKERYCMDYDKRKND